MNSDRSTGGTEAMRRSTRLLACGLALIAGSALAQGGPPMVTDDPGTPGDGHWEINLGAIATRMPHRREVAAPDADINYGWGERVQLKIDIPWVFSRDDGEPWKSGFGDGVVGVKWRFIDAERAGFSMSTYPQYTRSVLDSSARRGVAGTGHEFFLPLEVAGELGAFDLAAELGRNFVSGDSANQWVAGIVAGHGCGEGVGCLAEVHTTHSALASATLLNVGVHWKISDNLTFLGATGREFGTRSDDLRQALVYLGIQITR